MGKLTISMANFNSYVKLPEGHPQVSKQNFPSESPRSLTLFVYHGSGDQPPMVTPQQWLLFFHNVPRYVVFLGIPLGETKQKMSRSSWGNDQSAGSRE